MHQFMILFATGLKSGYAKVMPGTFGTLPAIPLILLTDSFSILTKFMIFIFLFVGGIIVSEYYEQYFNKKDPGEVVIDEIAAYYMMLMFIPISLTTLLLSFVLFRIFDITKPYPIKKLESIGGGVGIMLDDILAAIYALVIFIIIQSFM